MGFLKDWYDLTRFDHALLWGLSVVIAEFIAKRGLPEFKLVFFGFLIAALLEIGIFAFNDYIDLESDRINKRVDRPLVRGSIEPKYALYTTFLSLPLALIFGIVLNLIYPLIILISFLILGVLYDLKLKEYSLVKNFIVASCMAIPFIGGNMVVREDILPIIWVLASMGLTGGLGREVLKDMMDIEGDRAKGYKTLPILFGTKKTLFVVTLMFLICVVLTLTPYLLNFDPFYFKDPFYLAPLLLTDLIILYSLYLLWKSFSQEIVKKVRGLTLLAIEFGVLGFIFGLLF
ncbi:MAG: UbiA family prenyltransferase [Candidatus Methanofastidiosia archaeon]